MNHDLCSLAAGGVWQPEGSGISFIRAVIVPESSPAGRG
jgi:hypothetical protein